MDGRVDFDGASLTITSRDARLFDSRVYRLRARFADLGVPRLRIDGALRAPMADVIRAMTEETGAVIDIEDSGLIKIASSDKAAAEEAKRRIEQLTADVEVGSVYEGRVAKIMDFGAFVNILPGKDGLVHISQISNDRVESVGDKLSEGQMVTVKVLEVDRQGRIRLSMKAVDAA